jgi:hypothetical protein
MKGQQYAVTRTVHVGLQILKTLSDGALKRGRCVLWGGLAVTTMGEGQDTGVFKKSVTGHWQ